MVFTVASALCRGYGPFDKMTVQQAAQYSRLSCYCSVHSQILLLGEKVQPHMIFKMMLWGREF